MQTQSEPMTGAAHSAKGGEWAAHSETPQRSVFGNYRADDSRGSGLVPAPSGHTRLTAPAADDRVALQAAIDLAVARAFIHRYLAQAYADPTPLGWEWLCDHITRENLRSAWKVAQPRGAGIRTCCVADFQIGAAHPPPDAADSKTHVRAHSEGCSTPDICAGYPNFSPDAFDSFHSAYLAAFGHAARGSCPLNEIDYGELKADALFQPHRLADLAAFYRAFGLEVASKAAERHDHICLELEFMCVLAAKEAYALENQLDAQELALCRDAQRKFLREHLARWVPAFTRILAAAATDPMLTSLAEFTRVFIQAECARFGVHPGSEDLLLRPVDEAAESMCASCGLSNLPPGALATGAAA